MSTRLSTVLILIILVLAAIGLAGLASGNEGTATLFGIVICMPVSMIGGPLLLVLVILRVAEWARKRGHDR